MEGRTHVQQTLKYILHVNYGSWWPIQTVKELWNYTDTNVSEKHTRTICIFNTSALKMEAECFSETLVSAESTRRHNPEEHHLHRRGNLKSHTAFVRSRVDTDPVENRVTMTS
jgi:hypothetical protein